MEPRTVTDLARRLESEAAARRWKAGDARLVTDCERAVDLMVALGDELDRCIKVAPNADARTAYEWVKTFMERRIERTADPQARAYLRRAAQPPAPPVPERED